MKLTAHWAPSASLGLFEIVEIIRQDRPSAARKISQTILLAASGLNRNPRSGKIAPELLEHGISDYRQVLIPSHRVTCAIREHVDIVAVLDSRRDSQALLLQRLLR